MHDGEHQKHGAHQQLVGDGIEILPELRLLFERAGEQAVETIAKPSQHEQQQRGDMMISKQIDNDEGKENHAQQSELVGRSQQLR